MPSSERALVPVLVFVGLVSAAVGSLGAPLIPSVERVDHVSLAAAQWSLTVALLVGAVVAPVMGRIADGSRRREVTLVAVLTVLVGCVLSAVPGGFVLLLVGRTLQGVGLGLTPVTIATARAALPRERVAGAVALLSVTTAAGIGVGYPVAGVVDDAFGLHATYWLGAGVATIALVLCTKVLPRGADLPSRALDSVGAVLLACSLSGIIVAIGEGATWGWTSAPLLGIAVATVAVTVVWVAWELRSPLPLVDLRLLRIRNVFGANLIIFLAGAGIYPLLSLVSRLIQTPLSAGYGFGSTAVVGGLSLVPFSLGSFCASRVATNLSSRWTPSGVLSISCAVLIAAMAAFGVARTTLPELFITMGIAGVGTGGLFAANPLQLLRGLPAEETGSTMGFNQVIRATGFAAGSALSGGVLSSYTSGGDGSPLSKAYTTAALVSLGLLGVALVASGLISRTPRIPLQP